MKKIHTAAAIMAILFITTRARAQSDTTSLNQIKKFENPYNTNEFGGIYAIPLGDFGSKDASSGGFATRGFGFSFDSKTYLFYGFSFVSHSVYSWVNLDANAMSDQLTKDLGLKTVITGGQHQPFVSTVGVNYNYYFTKKICLGVNAQAGILYNSFKPFELKIYDNSNNVIYNDLLGFDSKLAFAYCGGTDLSFSLIPHVLAFKLWATYTASNVDTYLTSKYTDPIKSITKMQFMNLGIGFVVFNSK